MTELAEHPGLKPHPNPRYPLLPESVRSVMGEEWCSNYDEVRAAAIKAEEENPLLYGYESSDWQKADEVLARMRAENPHGVLLLIILGGIRASKTEWRSKRIVQNMLSRKNYIAWACHNTQASSRDAQQKKIYKYIPHEFKPESGRYRQGTTAKVNYTPWGGFTTDDFALPSPDGGVSLCVFKYYGIDPRSLRGTEIDEGWMDEEGEPEWLEVLITRAVSRNGVIFLTFTAENGYTPLLRSILEGARTIEEVDAELLPIRDASQQVVGHKKVPKVQINDSVEISNSESGKRVRVKAGIVYFHTQNNPYNDYEAFKQTYKDASEETILTLAYGVPTKAVGVRFPLFKDTVHVVSLNFWREVEKLGVTRYMLCDPTPANEDSGRNWFMLWCAVDPLGRKFYYREWPSHGHAEAYIPGVGDLGPWAVPGKPLDGVKGPAQTTLGWSLERYKEEILRVENGEEIFERWMDSRYGNAPQTYKEETTTLIRMMADLKMDFCAAPGDKIQGGIEMVQNALYYDVTQPVSPTNQPRMYVVETCPNLIFALKNWTGVDKGKGATKDPIDICRWVEGVRLGYVDKSAMVVRQPWMGQFSS